MNQKQGIDTVCVQGGYLAANGQPRQIPRSFFPVFTA